MNISCLLGIHRPARLYTVWERGCHVSACERCGREMTKYPAGKWEPVSIADRPQG